MGAYFISIVCSTTTRQPASGFAGFRLYSSALTNKLVPGEPQNSEVVKVSQSFWKHPCMGKYRTQAS